MFLFKVCDSEETNSVVLDSFVPQMSYPGASGSLI